MKRDDIHRAKTLESVLVTLEGRLAHFQSVTKLNIASACNIELQNYDDPSDIGTAFRAVRAALVEMIERQIQGMQRELRRLGVELPPG